MGDDTNSQESGIIYCAKHMTSIRSTDEADRIVGESFVKNFFPKCVVQSLIFYVVIFMSDSFFVVTALLKSLPCFLFRCLVNSMCMCGRPGVAAQYMTWGVILFSPSTLMCIWLSRSFIPIILKVIMARGSLATSIPQLQVHNLASVLPADISVYYCMVRCFFFLGAIQWRIYKCTFL